MASPLLEDLQAVREEHWSHSQQGGTAKRWPNRGPLLPRESKTPSKRNRGGEKPMRRARRATAAVVSAQQKKKSPPAIVALPRKIFERLRGAGSEENRANGWGVVAPRGIGYEHVGQSRGGLGGKASRAVPGENFLMGDERGV